MGSIVTMKNDIQSCITLMGELGYTLSEEEKMVLDEYFERSSDRVITALLERFSHIVNDDKRNVEFHQDFLPKKRFKVFAPALKFPNGFHDYEVLYYLEGKYAEKMNEMGLDEICISNPRLVPSFGSVADEFGVKYSAANTGRFFKDTSINYNLEVDVDYRKEKGIQLTKKKTN
jgi:hypothetical protein